MESTNPNPGPVTYPSPEYSAWAKSMVETRRAAVPDANGRLPPGATHRIEKYDDNGVPILVRVRFA